MFSVNIQYCIKFILQIHKLNVENVDNFVDIFILSVSLCRVMHI